MSKQINNIVFKTLSLPNYILWYSTGLIYSIGKHLVPPGLFLYKTSGRWTDSMFTDVNQGYIFQTNQFIFSLKVFSLVKLKSSVSQLHNFQ